MLDPSRVRDRLTLSVERSLPVTPERPKHLHPHLWEKVVTLRSYANGPFSGTLEDFHYIHERLRNRTTTQFNVALIDPKKIELAIADARKQSAAHYAAFDFHTLPWRTADSKDQFVQSMALRYSMLRMLYKSDHGVAAVNLFTERMAEQANYRLDMFQANHVRLGPPARSFSSHLREYSPSHDYVARVAGEIRPRADPLRAIAFRHAMKTGDRLGYYEDGDLFNAYSYLDRARERTVIEPAPELIEREHQLLKDRIQRLFDEGRRFTGSRIYLDDFKDQRPALSL